MPPQHHDHRLNHLVELCLERIGTEGRDAIEGVCREAPELAEGLKRRLATLEQLGLLDFARESEVPEVIGGYQLIELLGEGGMGIVYRALDPKLSREVALKILRPERLLHPGSRARFLREAEAAARLAHPGIVAIHGAGEHRPNGATSGVPYLALELIHGESLAEVLQRVGSVDPARLRAADLSPALEGGWTQAILRTIRDVALALSHAHERGVLHRDVKPSNIMLDESGKPRLLDFGLARALGETRTTRTGVAVGSLEYMAPEQVSENSDGLDARVDVFGLGVTLYELLTLSSPFQAETPEGTLRKIREGVYVSPRKRVPTLSRDVDAVCCQALAADRSQRYSDAAAFAADLDNVLELRPVVARHPSRAQRVVRAMRRRPELTGAGLLAVLGIAAVPLALAWREDRAEQEVASAHAKAEESELRLQQLFAALFDAVDPARLDPEAARKTFAELAQAGAALGASDEPSLANVERLLVLAGRSAARGVLQPARVSLAAVLTQLEASQQLDALSNGELRMSAMKALADLEAYAGNQVESDEWADRLLELDASLPERTPPTPERAVHIASTYMGAAEAARNRGEFQSARDSVRAARARLEPVLSNPRAELADVLLLDELARIERDANRNHEALMLAREVVELVDGLYTDHGPAAVDRERASTMSAAIRLVADLEARHGDTQAALEALERAQEELGLDQNAATPSAATFSLVYERAAVLQSRASLLAKLERDSEAMADLERAEAELLVAEERFGENLELLGRTSAIRNNLNWAWLELGQPRRAREVSAKALDLIEQLLEHSGAEGALRDFWRARALSLCYDLAVSAGADGDADECRLYYERAVRETTLDDPLPAAREVRTLAQLELGNDAAFYGDVERAMEWFDASQQSLESLEELANPSARIEYIRSGIARCRANAAIDANQPARAAEAYERQAPLIEAACARYPDDEILATDRREQLESRAILWTRAGEEQRAMDAVQRLEELAREDPEAARLLEALLPTLDGADSD